MKKINTSHLIKIRKIFTEEELLSNLNAVAKKLKKNTLTQEDYKSCNIKIATSKTIKKRFGKWNIALERAGLEVVKEMDIPEEKLLLNLVKVMEKLETPNFSKEDLVPPISKYSKSAYYKVFGNWTNTKNEFKKYLNRKTSKNVDETKIDYTLKRNHTTAKSISSALANQIKKKYKFVCSVRGCGCGEAISNKGKEYFQKIYVIHIKPWDEGGETIISNLKTFCEKHYKESLKKRDILVGTTKTLKRSRKIDPKVEEEVLRRDRHRCVHCKKGPYEKGKMYCEKIVIDHIKPFSKNGSNELKNLQVLCEKHNLEKMAKVY